MPQYLVANYLPDDFDPSTVTEAMMEEIHALNREMIAAGVRKFACGISPAANAKTLRKQPDGKVLVTDGPYIETKEHMGGFGYWKPPIWTRHSRGRSKGCHRLRCGGRGARASFLPGSGTITRRKQVNNLATAASTVAHHGFRCVGNLKLGAPLLAAFARSGDFRQSGAEGRESEMPAPNGLDHVSTTKSNGTRSIAAHPFHKLRAGSCKERKDGAPSVGTLHAEIVKGGPPAAAQAALLSQPKSSPQSLTC